MTNRKPAPGRRLYIGAAALILLLGTEAFILQTLFSREYDLGSFLMALAALLDLALILALGLLLGAPPGLVAPSLPFWQERAYQALLLLALLGNLAIFAYVSFRYPFLPPVLPLHYNILGEIDFLGTRAETFKIPGIGTGVLLVNLALGLVLHPRERLAATLLLATSVLVQVVLLVATISILQ